MLVRKGIEWKASLPVSPQYAPTSVLFLFYTNVIAPNTPFMSCLFTKLCTVDIFSYQSTFTSMWFQNILL